jgi:ABC-2 type transport system permease protein
MALREHERPVHPSASGAALRALAIHLQYARCAFQRRAAYRLANWSGAVVNLAFFVIHAEVIRAFYGARRQIGGWSADDAVVYYAISQSLLMVVTLFHDRLESLMDRIRSGDIVLDLARPLALYPRYVAERFGNGLYFLITRAVTVCGAGLALYRVAPPLGPHLWLAPISLALAIAVSASLWYLANASAFFTETP